MKSLGQAFPPLLHEADKAVDGLLKNALASAATHKQELREALIRVAPQPRVSHNDLSDLLPTVGIPKPRADPAPAADGDLIANPQCVVSFDSRQRKTILLATARVRRPLAEMAPIVDPRAWGSGGTVVGASFIVAVKDGVYSAARELGRAELGQSWKKGTPQLLYEYARSDFASFENILKITQFSRNAQEARADYQLHECLVFMLGLLSTPGGLTMNQGHVIARRSDWGKEWTDIEVLKEIRVRDMTPNDPGNPYDFGQAVNDTMGAALSSWIDDARFFRQVF
jgi:hypothetical protein